MKRLVVLALVGVVGSLMMTSELAAAALAAAKAAGTRAAAADRPPIAHSLAATMRQRTRPR
jgi:hypothetical protein